MVLTKKEMQIIEKKLNNKKLSQIDRNRLSRTIRPKLRKISKINSEELLKKLEYCPKSITIENKIIKTILENLPETDSIIIFGSVIQNNYREYNDIDVLIITKIKINGMMTKFKIIGEIKNNLKEYGINSDLEIISKKDFLKNYKSSPTLIYQLKDCKIIYGKIKIPNKIELYNIDLQMKLDWSDLKTNPKGRDIYNSLRNAVLVKLLMNKIIDNNKLKNYLYEELGKNIVLRLKSNSETKMDRKVAIFYLHNLVKKLRNEIGGKLWEKIQL